MSKRSIDELQLEITERSNWQPFYDDRERACPIFVLAPDENLPPVAQHARGKLTLDRRRPMQFTLECKLEEDGRWLAEVIDLPGALAYGSTAAEAAAKAQALALRALAERLELGEAQPIDISFSVPAGV